MFYVVTLCKFTTFRLNKTKKWLSNKKNVVSCEINKHIDYKMKMNFAVLLPLLAISCISSMPDKDDVVTISFDNHKIEVSGVETSDSVVINKEGRVIYVNHLAKVCPLTLRLIGSSDDAQVIFKTKTKDKIELDNVSLQSNEGAPLWIKNKRKVEIRALKGTDNMLTVTACVDTASNKAAVIHSKDRILFSGTGKLSVLALGDGCKGINAKSNITIEDITLDVKTTGDNLGVDTTRIMGFGGPGMGGMNMGPDRPEFNFDDLPDEVKQHIEEMKKKFENGEFPHHQGGPGFDMSDMPGPPHGEGEEGMPGFGGPGGKQKYISNCKGIKSKGKITINSGKVTVYTKSAGAEGIEGKEGVEINGGEVNIDAQDDAINADAQIFFNGGTTVAISRDNDAVDANFGMGGPPPAFQAGDKKSRAEDREPREEMKGMNEPGIIIAGGEVYAFSRKGAPEEGFDCDMSPLSITGGTAMSIGAGMGDMPSCPTNDTAKQPTVLLIGVNFVANEPVVVKDEKGRQIFTVVAPFSFNRSSTILTCPDFEVGHIYTIETANYSKTFKLEENFMTVR